MSICAVMVRRRYLVVLFLVAIAAVAQAVVPPEVRSLKVQASKHGLAEAIAAIDDVPVPNGFSRIQSANCVWYRCYYVGEPTRQVARSLLGILGSMGVNTTQWTATMKRQRAEADKQLRQWGLPLHRSQAPLGCSVLASPRAGPISQCALPATLDGHSVIVFLGPWFLDRYSTKHFTVAARYNALKHASEVDISLACGYGTASSQAETATSACPD